jgi:N-acetylglucosamine malate deacetylase 1
VDQRNTAVDLLVFGPHPDDLEIGLGGSIAQHATRGMRVGLCDLTRGELGTNGTPEERLREAEDARAVLGAAWRRNLEWPDGGITGTADQMRTAVELIRASSPRAIAIPHWGDRHPDHIAASRVLAEAAFKSRLRRYSTAGEPWQGGWVCYYFINDDFLDDSSNGGVRPSFLIDVSAEYEVKRRALACHRSQFQPAGADARPTRLTSPRFLQLIESRDAHYGALAGVSFAEAVVVREPIVRPDLFKAV